MKCINGSYKNIARSISFLDKIVIFVCADKYPYMLELLQFVNPESSLFSSILLISFLSWLVYSYVVTVCKELSRGLHGSSSLRKKHVYGGFIKVIIKEGLRAKEGLACLSSKFSLLKPNHLSV